MTKKESENRKAQDSAVRKRRQNAIKKDKARQPSTPYFTNSRGSNDQLFFRGNLCPFFVLSRAGKCLHVACHQCLCIICA